MSRKCYIHLFVYFIFIPGENAIVIVKGANDCITREDLQEAEKVIQNAKVLLCQLEINTEITLAALKMARKHKGKGMQLSDFDLTPEANFSSWKMDDVYEKVLTLPFLCIR